VTFAGNSPQIDYTQLSEQELKDRLECSPATIEKYLIKKGVMTRNLCINPNEDKLDVQFKGSLFKLAKYLGTIQDGSMTGTYVGGDKSNLQTSNKVKQGEFLNLNEPGLLANYLHNLNLISQSISEDAAKFSIDAYGYADGVRYKNTDFDDIIIGNKTYLFNNWSEIVDTNLVKTLSASDITIELLNKALSISNPTPGSNDHQIQIAASQIRNHYLAYARAKNIRDAFITRANESASIIPGITTDGVESNIHAHNSKYIDKYHDWAGGYCSPRRGALFKIGGNVVKQLQKTPSVVYEEETEIHPLFTTPTTKLMQVMNTHAVITAIKDIQDFINNESEGNFPAGDKKKESIIFMKKTLETLFPHKTTENDSQENSESLSTIEQVQDESIEDAHKLFEIIDEDNVRLMISRNLDSKDGILEKSLHILFAPSTKHALEYLKDHSSEDVLCKPPTKSILENYNTQGFDRFNSLNHILKANIECYITFYKKFMNHYIGKANEIRSDESFETIDKFFIKFIQHKYGIEKEKLVEFHPLIFWLKKIVFKNIKEVIPGNKIVLVTKDKIDSAPRAKLDIDSKLSKLDTSMPIYLPSYEAFEQLSKLMMHNFGNILKSFKLYDPVINRESFKQDSAFANFPFKGKENSFLKDGYDKDKYLWLLDEYSDEYASILAKEHYKRIVNNEQIHKNSKGRTARYKVNNSLYHATFSKISLYLKMGQPKANQYDLVTGDVSWNKLKRQIPKINFFEEGFTTSKDDPFRKGMDFQDPNLKNYYYTNSVKFHRKSPPLVYAVLDPNDSKYSPQGSDEWKAAMDFMTEHYHPFHAIRKSMRIFWNSYLFSITAHTFASSFFDEYKFKLPENTFYFDLKSYNQNNTKIVENQFFNYDSDEYRERTKVQQNTEHVLAYQRRPTVATTTVMSFFDYAEAYAEALNLYSKGAATDLSYVHRNPINKAGTARKMSYTLSSSDRAIVSKMIKPVSNKVTKVFYSPSLISSSVRQAGREITGFYHRVCKTGVFIENDKNAKATEFYYQSRYRNVKSTYTLSKPKEDDAPYFRSFDIPNPSKKLSSMANSFPTFNLIQLKRPTAYLIKNNCGDCSCLKSGNLTGQTLRSIMSDSQTERIDFSRGYTRYNKSGKDKVAGTTGPYAEKSISITAKGEYCLFSPIVPQSHDVGEGSSEDTGDEGAHETENEYMAGVYSCPMIDALYLTNGKAFPDVSIQEAEKSKIQQICKSNSIFPLAEDKYYDWCTSSKNNVCDLYTDSEISKLGVQKNECRRSKGMSVKAREEFELPGGIYQDIYKVRKTK